MLKCAVCNDDNKQAVRLLSTLGNTRLLWCANCGSTALQLGETVPAWSAPLHYRETLKQKPLKTVH